MLNPDEVNPGDWVRFNCHPISELTGPGPLDHARPFGTHRGEVFQYIGPYSGPYASEFYSWVKDVRFEGGQRWFDNRSLEFFMRNDEVSSFEAPKICKCNIFIGPCKCGVFAAEQRLKEQALAE